MKIFLSIISIFFISYTFGQEQDMKHQIGINFSNILNFSFIEHSALNKHSNVRYIPGISYKLYFEKIALRSSVKFINGSYDINEGSRNNLYTRDSASFTFLNLKLGGEIQFEVATKLYFIAAVDGIFEYNKRKGFQEQDSQFYPFYKGGNYSSSIVRVGLAPTIGLEYQISNQFSASIEANTRITYLLEQGNGNEKGSTKNDTNILSMLAFSYHF